MMFTLRLALLALALLASAVLANDGNTLGRWSSKSFDIGDKVSPLASLSPFHVRVSFPWKCSTQCGEFRTGGMPVMLFVTGFAGSLDAADYDAILTGVARHGIVVVAVDRASGFALTLDFARLGVQLQKVVSWIRQDNTDGGLMPEMRSRGFASTLLNGASKLILAGHSSGVHLVLRYTRDTAMASETCPDVGGVVMLSPLDGQDPVGLGGDTLLVEGKKVPFSVPGLIMSAALDPKSGDSLEGVACAPDARSSPAFMEAWVGDVNYIKVENVGHLDVLRDGAQSDFTQYCAKGNGTVQFRVTYREVVRGAIVNFIQGVVLNSQNYLDLLTKVPPRSVDAEFEVHGGSGRTFTCSYVPIAETMSFEVQTGLILFGFLFAITFLSGLYCFFRRMDDDTLHRYHPAEGMGHEQPASFQTKLEPQYPTASVGNDMNQSYNYSQASRTPSINV